METRCRTPSRDRFQATPCRVTSISASTVRQSGAPRGARNGRRRSSLLREALLEVFVEFLLERRVLGTGVKLTRLVLASLELCLGPVIVNVCDFGLFQNR